MDIQISNSTILTDIAMSERAIEAFVRGQVGDMEGFSDLEKNAILQIEKLRATSRVEFAKMLLRGRIIDDITRKGLFSVHPKGYNTLKEMARDVGISVTQLSNLISLYSYVIPYLQSALGMSEDEFCQIPKSNLNDVLPHLRMLISGEESSSPLVRDAVKKVLDDVNGIGSEDPVKSAVEIIIEIAKYSTNRMVRQYLNPEPTPNIDAVTFEGDNAKYIIARCTEDQWEMFQRLIGQHIDMAPENAEPDVLREVAALF